MKLDLHRPWLVAAWPGMGAVGQLAVGFLAQKLGAKPVADVPPRDYFELQSVAVQRGVLQRAQLPRSVVFGWKNPGAGRDLLILAGEAQPSAHGLRYCDDVLDAAAEFGVERVFTFAAMATPMHPEAQARVFGVTSRPELLDELRRERVELLEEGEISGLNGVFLGAAANRELAAVCLLGEFPYYASAVPNPKASSAVLRVFTSLAGVALDQSELDEQGRVLERRLVEHLERLQGVELGAKDDAASWTKATEDDLDAEARARIEALFREARRDRAKALELKAELDRLDVFKRYEDRFLDLFRRAE